MIHWINLILGWVLLVFSIKMSLKAQDTTNWMCSIAVGFFAVAQTINVILWLCS